MMVERLRKEVSKPTFYDGMERSSVQTCIVVLTREVTMNYVRNAHYWRSTVADLFLAMNVDISGAEDHLRCLDERLTPSQKCVLRLLYGEGCTLAQAAGMLGVSQDEVRTLQWQAMEAFHAEWLSLRLAMDARRTGAAS
ncbi:sigma factor-like helix-turn-helix DNA-binding protein [Fundidesulfovibrio magnetotacticus]|nr:sigma factor-like helix-turn-helix DNA-binding protein [Fundidesulfovibrio magnetotacticus]